MSSMSLNSSNVFSSKNLCEVMLSSLPKAASPHLRDPYDAVALLSHACMLAVGFRLEGLGEDHRIVTEPPSDPNSPQPLPSSWNDTTSSNYGFRYAHAQSSLHYILKISRLGTKAIINALGIGDEKVYTVEVPIRDFLSPSSLPFTVPTPSSSSSSDNNESSFISKENEHKLTACFISAGRITDLSALLKTQIIQRLAPGLRKEGYEESAHAAGSNTCEDRQREPPPERGTRDPRPAGYEPLRDDPLPPAAQPRPFHDPLAAEPRRPYPADDFPPPGFEDEYGMNRPPGGGPFVGDRRPLNIGERDLYPPGLGLHDPLRGGPGFGGLGGGGGGGMHPTFDDPLFAGNGRVGGVLGR
ncbi:MAG: hypothetical protein L6R41_002434 [Letrouitia leprolyta]|nr:MAG: hypothetical protein L6R41_002434 [Letrouitia leprolyta]